MTRGKTFLPSATQDQEDSTRSVLGTPFFLRSHKRKQQQNKVLFSLSLSPSPVEQRRMIREDMEEENFFLKGKIKHSAKNKQRDLFSFSRGLSVLSSSVDALGQIHFAESIV